jgi:hypothetical protein
MRMPPTFAERLLRWSLAAEEREAILGDVHEEWTAIAAARGAAAADRWYWAQTVLSIGPNLIRRIQGEHQRRIRDDDDATRASRRLARRFAAALFGVGALAFAIGVLGGDDLFLTLLIPLAFCCWFPGLVIFFSSFQRPREFDPESRARDSRRSWMMYLFYCLATGPHLLSSGSHGRAIGAMEWTSWVLGVSVLVWPAKYWIFGTPGFVRPLPQMRTPFIGPNRWSDGSPFLAVDAPVSSAELGDLILVRAGERQTRLTRVFRQDEAIRVFAPVGLGTAVPCVDVDVLDAHGRAVTILAETPVAGVRAASAPHTVPVSVEPGQIDVTLRLAELSPGSYTLRVTSTDGTNTRVKTTDFQVRAPTVPDNVEA